MRLPHPPYGSTSGRLAASPDRDCRPRHVGVILDGNRRWARAAGGDTGHGHRAGADKIAELLGWCEEVGVEVVTLWMLSTDNLNRPPRRARARCSASSRTPSRGSPRPGGGGCTRSAPSTCCRPRRRSGSRRPRTPPATCPACTSTSRSATAAARRSPTPCGRCCSSTPRSGTSSRSSPSSLDVEHIAEHLYTKGQPDPDLVIRTSGEQRLGGFLLWQSAHSEFYFCEAYWPDFRRVDFLRALRAYAARERRFGT